MRRVQLMMLNVLLILSLVGCLSTRTKNNADIVAEFFATGLQEMEIDILMSAFHSDADFTFVHPSEGPQLIKEGGVWGILHQTVELYKL